MRNLSIIGDPKKEFFGLIITDKNACDFSLRYLAIPVLEKKDLPHISASAEMAIGPIEKLLEVVLEQYGDGPLNPLAASQRYCLREALAALLILPRNNEELRIKQQHG